MRVVVDTAAATVSELRFGVLVAGWGEARRQRLEASIEATTVVPVSCGAGSGGSGADDVLVEALVYPQVFAVQFDHVP